MKPVMPLLDCIVPEHDPVYKVTIIPRGRALGVTMFLPEEDRYSYTKQRLESQISQFIWWTSCRRNYFWTPKRDNRCIQ